MARGITLYLKDGIAEDDQIRAVWEAASAGGRPQELFRRLMMLGIRAAFERGELPHAAMSAVDPVLILPPGSKGGLRLPGVPSDWRLGDPPLLPPKLRPRGRHAPPRAVPDAKQPPAPPRPVQVVPPPAPPVDEPQAPRGGLGRLMG